MAGRIGVSSEDSMDSHNRQMSERLSQKVTTLKSLAFDIESEAKDHNHLLRNVDDDFDSTGGFLSGTVNRMSTMIARSRGNRKVTCYIGFGIAALFLIFYYGISHLF
ncbi:BET1-like protein [Chamberlinius hualienensis]